MILQRLKRICLGSALLARILAAGTSEAHAQEQPQTSIEHRQFTLEVLGLGLAVEKFRQTWTWEAIEQLPPEKTILPADPKAYPWSTSEKDLLYTQRAGDSLEHSLSWFVTEWPIPVFLAGPPMYRAGELTSLSAPYFMPFTGYTNEPDNCWVHSLDGGPGGLHRTSFVAVETLYEDSPEAALEHAFAFMENHSEVPAVLLFVHDGSNDRDANRAEGAPGILKNGYRQPGEMTESFTALLLARHDRVEAMRDHVHVDSLVPFWDRKKPAKPLHATEFMPKPWTRKQFGEFDQLPVLGHLHRPQTVPFVKEGKALGDQGRIEAFATGWKAALETLPEGVSPSRVLYDCGPGQAARVCPLVVTLHNTEPELDVHKPAEGVDLTGRLGDTGADAFFVGTALGVIASHRHDNASAVVSFRDPDHATIVMVTPPTAEERQKRHPGGNDPLNLPLAQ